MKTPETESVASLRKTWRLHFWSLTIKISSKLNETTTHCLKETQKLMQCFSGFHCFLIWEILGSIFSVGYSNRGFYWFSSIPTSEIQEDCIFR
jgi:hypothetical protein